MVGIPSFNQAVLGLGSPLVDQVSRFPNPPTQMPGFSDTILQ
jgi:hypothetical protein